MESSCHFSDFLAIICRFSDQFELFRQFSDRFVETWNAPVGKPAAIG